MKEEEFNRRLSEQVTKLLKEMVAQDKGVKIIEANIEASNTEDGLGRDYKIVVRASVTFVPKS